MKKLALLSLLITSVLFGYSQSQRLVMLEHFTQASCGPCASVNPTIHNNLVNNPEKITCINFHTSWPGYDPMYNHNPTDPTSRVTYYNVSSVPHSVLDGNFYSGHPSGWNMTSVNQRWAVPSPFTLSVNQRLSATNDTLFVTMLVEATAPVTGPITAFMGVIEKLIHYNSAPGSNGEKDFYNVLKKMLPSKSGIVLPTPMQTGDYVIIESYWVLANVISLDQLSVVSYIQNPTSKEVHQAANLTEAPITAVHDNDVEFSALPYMIPRYCENTINPVLNVRNNGNNDLTDMIVKYQINNEEIQSYQWTGNLHFLDKSQIELPQITFNMQDTNVFKVYVDQVNQTQDEYSKNDTIVYQFLNTYQVGHSIQLKIRTDNSPGEVTWVVLNSVGETVASGGPYTEVNTMYTENIELDGNGCHEFFIYDSGENGLCCGNGTGFYSLKYGSTVIAQGTQFGYQMSAQFDVTNVATDNPDDEIDLKVYPNPASNRIWIEIPSVKTNFKVSVTNQIGQKIFESSTSESKYEINTQSWPNGIYIVALESIYGVKIQKINIVK